MIHQQITLDRYDKWLVDVYFGVTHWDVNEIMSNLHEIGCDGKTAYKAYENLSSGNLNTGLTYSNFAKRQSIMVVGVADSAEQFLNTLTHEQFHLTAHIGRVFYLDMYGEEVSYLMGDISQALYKESKKFICDCCRKELDYEKE